MRHRFSVFFKRVALAVMAGVGVIVLALSPPVQAEDTSQMARLWAALRMDDTLAIMRTEGRDHALASALELTGQEGGEGWQRIVDQIYDPARLRAIVYDGMGTALAGRDMSKIITYYESKIGARVIRLEISARKAYLTPGVEEAAREAWNWGAKSDPRAGLIRKYVNDGDLIERNVAGALNSNVAFLTAFAKAAPKDFAVLDDRAILADVMQEEPQIRLDTTEWLFGYLSMAYAPLSDAALSALVEMSDSPEGRALNAALFHGFDPMYQELARALGQAAGQAQSQQEL